LIDWSKKFIASGILTNCLCTKTLGKGQFRPLPESNPHQGQQDVLENVEEFKLEIECIDSKIKKKIRKYDDRSPV